MGNEFWDAATPLMGEGVLEEGTIMNGACVRDRSGEFVAMPHHQGEGMVVKLPRDRVQALVDTGEGKPFAPANKVFKEWVLVERYEEAWWQELLRESLAFVGPDQQR